MTLSESGIKLNVLGVGSSMRQRSYSTSVLKLILSIAKGNMAETKLLDLRQTNLPMLYSARDDTDEIIQTTELVKRADAFILATPDYHGSMSGSLKNFLDYFWSEFAGKTFGYIVASHEKGLTVMDQMRTAVRQCYGWSLPYGISIHGDHDFNRSGNVTNESLLSRLEMLARDLMVYSKLLRKQFLDDVNNDEQFSFAKYYS